MLFDPLEEQFDLPTTTVQLGNGQRRQCEVVGQKDQTFPSLGILEFDSPQWRIETLPRIKDGEHHGLVADQAGGFVDFVGVAALDLEIGLGASNKETACLAQSSQTLEVDVAAVHDVEGSWLGDQLVEHVDLVPFAIADTNERRDIASQVQQRVQLDRRLGRTERRPRKHRQAQIDGGRIESIDGIFQATPKGSSTYSRRAMAIRLWAKSR
jgi:hypothetical protein